MGGFAGYRSARIGAVGQEDNAFRFSGLADWLTEWSYPRPGCLWIASIAWTGTGAPTGDLYFMINADSQIPPDSGQDSVIALPVGSPGTYGAWPSAAGVAGNAQLFVKNPPGACRVGYTRTGGGAANQFRVVYSMRAT